MKHPIFGVALVVSATLFSVVVIANMSARPVHQTAPEIIVSKNTRVSIARDGGPFIEPTIAAHPDDSNAMVISSSELIGSNGHGSVKGLIATSFVTQDGGQSWTRSELPGMKEGLARNDFSHSEDTWTTFSPKGIVYLSALTPKKLTNDNYETRIVVYRSSDGGRTWQGPTSVPGRSFDAPSIVATADKVYIESNASGRDAAIINQPFSGDIIALLRSDDDGKSFKSVSFIAPDNAGHHSTRAIALPDDTLLLAFNDHPRREGQRLRSGRFYVAKVTNNGEKPGLPQFVSDAERVSVPGSIGVDASTGQFKGRIYAVWESGNLMYLNYENVKSAANLGKNRDVSIAYSTNGGAGWSAPVMLRGESGGPAYYANVVVNRAGVVGVAWLQHESNQPERLCYRIYFAASLDGGKTFSQPRVVSDAVSCPDSKENLAATFPPDNNVVESWPRGGDYIGLAAAADGSFHPVWIDGRDGLFQVYTARVDVRDGVTSTSK